MDPTNWYGARASADEEHPVDREVDQRMRSREGFRELDARVLGLGGAFQEMLRGESKKIWLELEADIHARCALLTEEYYNVGVRDGLVKRAADEILGLAEGGELQLSPADAVRAIATALAEIARRLGP